MVGCRCPFDHPLNGESTPVLDFGAIERFLMAVIAGDQQAVEQMLQVLGGLPQPIKLPVTAALTTRHLGRRTWWMCA